MAAPSRRADAPVERVLFEEAYRFDFFQAVRLLARLDPGRAPVGRDGPPGREAVRFAALASLSFPPSAIHRIDRPDGSPPEMSVAFLGLTGPQGVLPTPYTELLMERRRAGDRTLEAFLDLFHHRLISLFYRAWEKYHVAIPHERGDADALSGGLLALIGLGARPLRSRHDFPDEALLAYTGAFARRHRPAVVLEGLLGDAFGLPVAVEQFVGRWLRLDPADRSTLGARGAHHQLGASLVVGGRIYDEQSKVRLRIGPLGFDQFLTYLPDGPAFRPLAQMARLFLDSEFDVDVQLVLRAGEVPACRLSSAPGAGARLGRYAWLKSREFTRDVDDAVFPAGT